MCIRDRSFTVGSAIGGERDLQSEILSGTGGEDASIRTDTGRLLLETDVTSQGEYTVTWDGLDGTGAGLDETGLGGQDLTAIGGTTGLGQGISLTDIAVDQPGAIVTVRVYTSPTQFSESVVNNIPVGMSDLFLPFSGTGANAFAAAGG